MSNTNYTFAVARIRALEVSLFSKSVIDQLMACKTYEECMRGVMAAENRTEIRCFQRNEKKYGRR